MYKYKILNNIYNGDIPADLNAKLDVLKERLSLSTDTIGLKKIIGEKVNNPENVWKVAALEKPKKIHTLVVK